MPPRRAGRPRSQSRRHPFSSSCFRFGKERKYRPPRAHTAHKGVSEQSDKRPRERGGGGGGSADGTAANEPKYLQAGSHQKTILILHQKKETGERSMSRNGGARKTWKENHKRRLLLAFYLEAWYDLI